MNTSSKQSAVIGVVGPCTAGKSTLIQRLLQEGLVIHPIAQEHSYVQDMWRKITNPDILIYLDVSYAESLRRRNLNWTEAEFSEQFHRLKNARLKAHYYLLTDGLTPEDVAHNILGFLKTIGVEPKSSTFLRE
jgi:deoxyadenosine/deoxycytidine kinase